ncbi:FAD-dependent oxidoreductase [Lacrimispora xylanisolvens]|uniref:FAD-dependent oxidoreductase n=1 Tax=Lacrimispora xylanisolvens TaxID=384636 RepID=UPI003D9C9846
MNRFDLIIIGAGPAGLSAAISAAKTDCLSLCSMKIPSLEDSSLNRSINSLARKNIRQRSGDFGSEKNY